MKFAVRGLLLLVLGTVASQAQIQYPNPIKHVIIVIQENRTPDNLFGSNSPSNQYYLPGAALAPNNEGLASQWQNGKKTVVKVPLISIPLSSVYNSGDNIPVDDYDPVHSHPAFLAMCDLNAKTGNCAMDGANRIHVVCDSNLPKGTQCPPSNPQFAYVQYKDVAPYFQIASQYGYANNMFQTNQGESFTAHQLLFGGTSQPGNGNDPTWFVSEAPLLNGKQPIGANLGCIAPTAEMDPPNGETVQLINPNTRSESTTMYPCFEHQTLGDLLDNPPQPFQPVSWKYYTPGAGSLWSAPDAIDHICVPEKNSQGQLVCTGSEYNNHLDLTPSDVLKDIKNANCVLPQVSWVIPNAPQSDHAGSSNGTGPAWVASIVNAIGGNTTCDVTNGNKGYWYDTAILITWDDWGGWYDHVPPPALPSGAPPEAASFEYGFRVPFLVVSAYTPAATISNTNHDFGSVLRFVEDVFGGLGPISPGTYADSYANGDLQEFFSFSSKPSRFKKITAPLDADYFINDKTPMEGPDND